MVFLEKHKNSLYGVAVTVVVVYTFIFGMSRGMHQTIPLLGYHLRCMSMAISELQYGLKDYVFYNKVFTELSDAEGAGEKVVRLPTRFDRNNSDHVTYAKKVNAAIQRSIHIRDVSSGGKEYVLKDDKGIAFFYKTAFLLFGFKIEGAFYLYFLLFAMTVGVFFFSFSRREELLRYLLLYVCAHFVVVAVTPEVGAELLCPINVRFFPVLSILPTIYLALLIMGKQTRPQWFAIAGAVVQAGILLLAVYIRTSAMYQILFLGTFFFFRCLWFLFRAPSLWRYLFDRVPAWPLGLVIAAVLILNTHHLLALNYPYNEATTRHLFWHPAYLGLGAHPESKSKYGIVYDDDRGGFAVADRYLPGVSGNNPDPNYLLQEQLVKEEYFRILKRDPRFFIENYLYKIPRFLKTYFDPASGVVYYMFFGINLVVLMALILLEGLTPFGAGFGVLLLTFSIFCFSCLPWLFYMPAMPEMADSVLLFTFCFYLIFTKGIGQAFAYWRTSRENVHKRGRI